LQLAEMKISESEEEACAAEARFQAKCFLQVSNRIFVAPLLFEYETEIKVGFRKGGRRLGDGGETLCRFLKVSGPHGFGGLPELVGNGWAYLRV